MSHACVTVSPCKAILPPRRSERRVAGHTSEGQRSSAPVKRAKIGKLFLTMSLVSINLLSGVGNPPRDMRQRLIDLIDQDQAQVAGA